MAPIFTVDLEDHLSAIVPFKNRPTELCDYCYSSTEWLLDKLAEYKVKAIFYILGMTSAKSLLVRIRDEGHTLGSHGFFHNHKEHEFDQSDFLCRKILGYVKYYRSPYWDTTPRPGKAGGFYLRVLPYTEIKDELIRTGILYVHPHDILNHDIYPKCRLYYKNSFYWCKRHIGLATARPKIEQLLYEVKWDEPG